MSFLALPTELRFQIYSYLAIPTTTPFSAYTGFYTSCRQIKSEMDSECTAIFRAHLAAIVKDLQDVQLHVQSPTSNTFPAPQYLHLSVLDDPNFISPAFAHLLSLHLPSITFSQSPVDRENLSPEELDAIFRARITPTELRVHQLFAEILLLLYSPHKAGTNARRVVMLIEAVGPKSERFMIHYENVARGRFGGKWGFRREVEGNGKVRAVWERDGGV